MAAWEGVEWIDLARYSDRWRADMNMVMKLCVPPTEEQRLKVFENRVLRRYLGLRGKRK
jgi:hypothetical protein